MKAIYAFAISMVLPATLIAQSAGAGAGAAGASGSAAVGAARSAGVAGSGAVSPTGVLSGQAAAGGTVTTPSGTPIATPGTATPVGPINPGGITATPPQTAGRTFDRPIIGGGPLNTAVDPAGPQPTFRFPPASAIPGPAVTLTNSSGLPDFRSFPPGRPVGVGNVVGTNMGSVLTGVRSGEPVAVDLPPGAVISTNVVGVPEVVVPPPSLINTNVGGRRGVEIGRDTSIVVPRPAPRTIPPGAPRATPPPPLPSRGPILDSLDEDR